MLLLLIPIAWITVAAFFVILCRAGAPGSERMGARAADTGVRHPGFRGLVLWEAPPAQMLGRRLAASPARVPVTSRAARARAGRCALGR